MAMLPASTETKAAMLSADQASSANVAPVTTTDSPSAMMTKSAQRSAMWPPSITQSETEDAPYRGIQNRTAGEIYSMTSAIAQSTSRDWSCASPPAIQKTADVDSHAVMRTAFMRVRGCEAGVENNKKMGLRASLPAKDMV